MKRSIWIVLAACFLIVLLVSALVGIVRANSDWAEILNNSMSSPQAYPAPVTCEPYPSPYPDPNLGSNCAFMPYLSK
jgi:hypothetical protein